MKKCNIEEVFTKTAMSIVWTELGTSCSACDHTIKDYISGICTKDINCVQRILIACRQPVFCHVLTLRVWFYSLNNAFF